MNATYTVIVSQRGHYQIPGKNDPESMFVFSTENQKKETIYTWL